MAADRQPYRLRSVFRLHRLADHDKNPTGAHSLTGGCNDAGGVNERRASCHSGAKGTRVAGSVARKGKLPAKGSSGFRHDPDVGKIDLSGFQNIFRCPYMIGYVLGGLYPYINNLLLSFERLVIFVDRRGTYQISTFGTLDGTISFRQAASFDQPLDNQSLKLVPIIGNLLLYPIQEQGSGWIIPIARIEFAKWSASVGPLHT